VTTEEEEMQKVKDCVKSTVLQGEYFKATIIAIKSGPFTGEHHVIGPFGRQAFLDSRSACKWVAMYFLQAAIAPTIEQLRAEDDAQD
jgi:hypothetical protein